MTPKQAILTEVTSAREEARVRMHLLSMAARERYYDLQAELDTVEHRLQAGGEGASDALLRKAGQLAGWLRALARDHAA